MGTSRVVVYLRLLPWTPFLLCRNELLPAALAIGWCGARRTSSCWPCTVLPKRIPNGRDRGWHTRCVARPFPFPPTSPRVFGKRSQAEKARFLNIAEGPLEECRYYNPAWSACPRRTRVKESSHARPKGSRAGRSTGHSVGGDHLRLEGSATPQPGHSGSVFG